MLSHLDQPASLASTTTAKLPGTVYLGNYASNDPTNILYSVDAGGPAISSSDGGPDWAADTSSSPSAYVSGQGGTADEIILTVHGRCAACRVTNA